jgi:hypothetical protein
MSEELNHATRETSSRKGRLARRGFIGAALLGGAGWWLSGAVRKARFAAQHSSDK